MGVLDSIGRQFDSTKGGGFADETLAVADPRRAASPETERQLREVSGNIGGDKAGVIWGALTASDVVDATSGNPENADHIFGTSGKTTPAPDSKNVVPKGAGSDLGALWTMPSGKRWKPPDVTPDIPWWVLPLVIVTVLAIVAGQFGKLLTLEHSTGG